MGHTFRSKHKENPEGRPFYIQTPQTIKVQLHFETAATADWMQNKAASDGITKLPSFTYKLQDIILLTFKISFKLLYASPNAVHISQTQDKRGVLDILGSSIRLSLRYRYFMWRQTYPKYSACDSRASLLHLHIYHSMSDWCCRSVAPWSDRGCLYFLLSQEIRQDEMASNIESFSSWDFRVLSIYLLPRRYQLQMR